MPIFGTGNLSKKAVEAGGISTGRSVCISCLSEKISFQFRNSGSAGKKKILHSLEEEFLSMSLGHTNCGGSL